MEILQKKKRTKKEEMKILVEYVGWKVKEGYDISGLLCKPLSRFDYDVLEALNKESRITRSSSN